MKNVLIGVIGEDDDAVKVLLKSFSRFYPQVISVLVKKGFEYKINELEEAVENFSIEIESNIVSDFLELEEVFREIKFIVDVHKDDLCVINVDCDYMSSCLALSSAFVNGVLAIGMLRDKIITYPIMKFSYYNAINDKKRKLIKIIGDKSEIESMEKLSKLSNMSLPLIAYHLKGNKDSKGLVEMNLVEIERVKGYIKIKLSSLGRLIVNHFIDEKK